MKHVLDHNFVSVNHDTNVVLDFFCPLARRRFVRDVVFPSRKQDAFSGTIHELLFSVSVPA